MNRYSLSAFLVTSLLFAGVFGEDRIEQSHLLSLVSVGGVDTLAISTIPASNAKDQSISTRTLFSEQGMSQYGFCGVYGGYLIVLEEFHTLPTRLLAIELTTGKKKLISQATCVKALLVNHHLYFVVKLQAHENQPDQPRHALYWMDLRTGNQKELCLLTNTNSHAALFDKEISLAATVDGSKIAVTEWSTDDDDQVGFDRQCRIVTVDTQTGEVTRSQQKYSGGNSLTGALDSTIAPKIFWRDDQTLLVTSGRGDISQKLYSYDPTTQSSEEVCHFPIFYGRGVDPKFSFGGNGKILVRLGLLGFFEILFPSKKLKEYVGLIEGYPLKKDGNRLSLYYADKELESEFDSSRVFVSSDSQQIAWLPSAAQKGVVLSKPMELKVHDRSRGLRTVTTQTFPYRFQSTNNDHTAVCLWVSDRDLPRSIVFDQLSDYSKDQIPPHIDSRPSVDEVLEVSLKTDKLRYEQHEPIALTITLRNLTDTPIHLESRWLKQGSQPFNDLYLVARTSKIEIPIKEGFTGELLDEFATIPARESNDFDLLVESSEIGPQEFQMRFECYSLWRGHLKASAKFQVDQGRNEAELKRKKFDRLLTQELREYRNNPTGKAKRDRFQSLGPSCLPWLAEHLQNCDDLSFRQFLSDALSAIADETTLPFLKGLLETDLEIDGGLLIAPLWGIYHRGDFASRPVPETVLLLIEAGKHRSVEVRKRAVATLCHCVNETVDAFMQHAAEDSNPEVASIAARYVAARQQLSLQIWLTEARFTMTPAGLVAARSIIHELEQLSQEKRGMMPEGTFEEVIADTSKVAQYLSTLKAWILYCATNPRTVGPFFDKDRNAATWWMGWGIDRYASGANVPIKLNPRSKKFLD
ncbi:HEAT repeat domain-containing protein [Pirellulaceae bacterium SH449]